MCGIAGIIGTPNSVTRARLQVLASSLAHRGPDDEGIEVIPVTGDPNRSIGFVHRRLAIIDLSPAGHQPMRDPETGNWITFNGEIYNYRELRSALVARGHRFHSQSDTEVILRAYAEYGSQCLDQFRGMFAFALWDAGAQRLFAAVDRFGIKPFYYWSSRDTFAFASEFRALLGTGLFPRNLDGETVDSFLAFGAVQAPRTMVAGVRCLLPGHTLTYDARTHACVTAAYWQPAPSEAPVDDASIEVALRDSVTHHLVSDVPVGLFLSGGVDSSALAVLVHRVVGKALESFSVTFRESAYAEGELARLIGEQFCVTHHEIVLRAENLRDLLPSALAAMDQPTIDGINAYAIASVVRAAGIKVVLSGQGGDEVFGGYPTFRRLPRMLAWGAPVAAIPRPLRAATAALLAGGATARPARAKLAAYVRDPGDALTSYALSRQLMTQSMRQELLGFRTAVSPSGVPAEVERWLWDALRGRDPFSVTSILELRGYLANMLLRDGDVMTMAHGLEVRVPYLDHPLLERVLAVPMARKVHATLPKPLLLRAVRQELPRTIYDRPKMGFTFPWEIWLRGPLRGMLEERLRDPALTEAVGLHPRACTSLWERFLRRERGISWPRVWAPYVLMDWAQRNVLS